MSAMLLKHQKVLYEDVFKGMAYHGRDGGFSYDPPFRSARRVAPASLARVEDLGHQDRVPTWGDIWPRPRPDAPFEVGKP